MKLDPNKYYRMPLIMGPLFDRRDPPRIVYTEIEVVAVQYETEIEAVQALLPDCYQPAKDPIVTVLFGCNNGLEFMAGGEYRLATVQVAARFDGERDHVEGDYILVMFEDKTFPIIGGREDIGVPKLYGDISSIKTMRNKHLRCEVSLWGHFLFGVDIEPLKKQNALIRLAASKRVNARPWLGYKYIPSLEGPPDADYPVVSKNDTKIEQLWLGNSAEVYFGSCTENDVGPTKNIVEAIKTLPICRVVQTLRLRGSAVLRYDQSHRLK